MVLSRVLEAIVTLGYFGKFPKFPGTVGTLVAVPLALWAFQFGPKAYFLTTLFVIFLSYVSVYFYEKHTGHHDASKVVIDELAGFFVTLVPFAYRYEVFSIEMLVLGFLWFRIFDIFKPYPISKIDAMKTASSTVSDDLLAGVFAALFSFGTFQVLRMFF